MSDPTDQSQHLFLQALQQQEQRRQVFLQQQQPPQHPHPQLAMQQQHPQAQAQMLPARAPSPQGFGGVALMPPMQGVGLPAQAAAARARAAERMAFEDAWNASNPDFKTPFASVEDAVSRCVRACVPRRSPLLGRRRRGVVALCVLGRLALVVLGFLYAIRFFIAWILR